MKKVFAALIIALTFVSLSIKAQSNVTLALKEKTDQAYFNKTTFEYEMKGFSNENEATAFCAKMKQNTDVLSVEDKGKNTEGNYNVIVTMKKPFEKNYYLNWANKLGISYIQDIKGNKKSPQELLTEKETKHTEEPHR